MSCPPRLARRIAASLGVRSAGRQWQSARGRVPAPERRVNGFTARDVSRDNSYESAMGLEKEIPEAVIRGAQEGDAAALSRLLSMVRPRLYRWALIQTESPDDAEDIVQETLMRVSRSLGGFAFAARFTTWVHAILRTTAADRRRTRKRREALLAPMNPVTIAHHVESPEPLLEVIRSSLGVLTARQREIFDLIDMREYTPAEAATLLGMNATTVRVHLMRARRKLRTRILELHPHIVEDMR